MLPQGAIATATALLLLTSPGASYSEKKNSPLLEDDEPAKTTSKSVQSATKPRALDTVIPQAPLEFEIDPAQVRKNQEVLNELYRNVYRYGSGVLNYEKKIN